MNFSWTREVEVAHLQTRKKAHNREKNVHRTIHEGKIMNERASKWIPESIQERNKRKRAKNKSSRSVT